MVHRILFRIGSKDALKFWHERLAAEGARVKLAPGRLRFTDPEGLGFELRVAQVADEPLVAEHPEIPGELAIQGFDGVRAFATDPQASRAFFEGALAFEARDEEGWEARGSARGSTYAYDA